MTSVIRPEHVSRALADVAKFGDNDVLPFDVDTRFVASQSAALVPIICDVASLLDKKQASDCRKQLESIFVFHEKLLAPVGPAGFRVTTKIDTFWNLYLNSVAVALAELHEPNRSSRVHSYRFDDAGPAMFQRVKSWKKFKKATLFDCDRSSGQIVVMTDISSFYEHVYHHRLENYVSDIQPEGANLDLQLVSLLKKLSSGRSFGLPVGGQCSRVLSEILLGSVDRRLSDEGIGWHRYVDDFVMVADNQTDAYRALALLSHLLADLGLSLNRTKTNLLHVNYYCDQIEAQLGDDGSERAALREIDLHFDPYSDTADDDYDSLREVVQGIDIGKLVVAELDKGQPDSFVINQAGRALALMPPEAAKSVARTLLAAGNLHKFRSSFSSIMRGIATVRSMPEFSPIHTVLDTLLDNIPEHSRHLVSVDSNCLHYLRAIRFTKLELRAKFVASLHRRTQSATMKRACVGVWHAWSDRDRFVSAVNKWPAMSLVEQRMLWLAAGGFGDDGRHFRTQHREQARNNWALGLQWKDSKLFADIFIEWAEREESQASE